MSHLNGLQTMTVHVNDFAKARQFYQKVFGGKELMADEQMGWCQLQLPDGTMFGIHIWDENCQKAGGRAPGTVSGMVLEVADAHAFAEEVEAAGGELTDPVEQMPWGPLGGTMADLDGNEFAFSEPMEQ
ncbi:MAG: VOC family protein [Candidatus Thermoplasmatota archaeon]|nr:VOC family protein [Candidatus Thermoplasmatota archaeon]